MISMAGTRERPPSLGISRGEHYSADCHGASFMMPMATAGWLALGPLGARDDFGAPVGFNVEDAGIPAD